EQAEGAVLLVVGPSGGGKSSLVRAGLVPTMVDEPGWWALAPFVPGVDPVAELARVLARGGGSLGLGWVVGGVGGRLDGGGWRELVDGVVVAARSGCRRLLVVVDQFEELLTQTPPERRARFVELLRSGWGGPLRVVATLRAEFLEPLLVSPELHGI